MKYFLHDTSAFDDEKITELYINFGYEGLGLFYTLLEKLGKQEKPIKTDVLKAQLKVGKRLEKCWKFMEKIGIISSNNGETFNKQLLNYSQKYQIKKEKTRIKVAEWRKNQEDSENVTSYNNIRNDHKVNKSKLKENKDIKEYKDILLCEITPNDFEFLNPDYINIAKSFQELFKSNIKEAGNPTTIIDKAKGKWIDDIRLIIETDGYTVDDLRDIFEFLKYNEFWKKNILSTDKLRKQIVKLKMEIKTYKNGTSRKQKGATDSEIERLFASTN